MRTLACVLLLVLASAPIGCRSTLHQADVGIAKPVETLEGVDRSVSRDDRFIFGGQPDVGALRALRERGVTKVISLRTDEEMASLDFDERALVESLGMEFVQIPFSGEDLDDGVLDPFQAELMKTRDPIFIHCSSSNRVGAVWGRYLRVKRGFSTQEALLRASAAGLRSQGLAEWVASPVPPPEEDR